MSQLHHSLEAPSKVAVLNLHSTLTLYAKVTYQQYKTFKFSPQTGVVEFTALPENDNENKWQPILPINNNEIKPVEFAIKSNTARVEIYTLVNNQSKHTIASGIEIKGGETIVFRSLSENIQTTNSKFSKIGFCDGCMYSIKLKVSENNNAKRLIEKSGIRDKIECKEVSKDESCFALHLLSDTRDKFYIECKSRKDEIRWLGCKNENTKAIFLRKFNKRSVFRLTKDLQLQNNEKYYKIAVKHCRNDTFKGYLTINDNNELECALKFQNNYFTFEKRD